MAQIHIQLGVNKDFELHFIMTEECLLGKMCVINLCNFVTLQSLEIYKGWDV